jgi:hypothetical protein
MNANEIMKNIVSLMVLFPIVILYGCRESKPSEIDGQRALMNIINHKDKEFNVGQIQIVSFHKTNGILREQGVKYYDMEYECEIEFARDCAWRIYRSDGKGGLDTYNTSFRNGWNGIVFRPMKAGQRGIAAGMITFEKTDNGWRSVGE